MELNAATLTPYHADGTVAYEHIDAHAADLAKNKVPYAFGERGLGRAVLPRY